MTKDQAIHYMLHNPHCHVRHQLFAEDEWLYSRGDGIIYDEVGNVFEDFTSHCAGMRFRHEPVWLTGWTVVLGPDPELPDEHPTNALDRLFENWDICHFMRPSDKNELIKYLVDNGVTVGGKE